MSDVARPPSKRQRTSGPGTGGKRVTDAQWATFDEQGYVVLEPEQVR